MTVRTRVLAAIAALALVAGFGVYLGGRELTGSLPITLPGRGCVVEAEGRVQLTGSQMANAATIAAIGLRRKMPEQAVVVALATAFQESQLENLAGGDRDSVGLFQQRPSQGWGTPEQIRDPRYAANRFYAALKKVRGWEEMRVTDAAQAVQRSAFPEAYEKWADESAVLARALVGNATGAVVCRETGDPALRGTAAADALGEELRLDWGKLETAVAAELTGLAVPVADERAGWRYAHWLVSHAHDHGVRRVRFGALEWTSGDDSWSAASGGAPAADRVIAEVFTDE
nr:hypothetical protein [Micromonospora sp. DSM 115978]